jgi:hypothetical protein
MVNTKTITFNGMSLGEALRANNQSVHSFFGIESKSDFLSEKQKEAQLLIIDHFNGIEVNFGFTKPVGVRVI